MENKKPPQLYRREQVAEKLGISLRGADELILSKQIPSIKIGSRRLVSETALASFIEKAERAAR